MPTSGRAWCSTRFRKSWPGFSGKLRTRPHCRRWGFLNMPTSSVGEEIQPRIPAVEGRAIHDARRPVVVEARAQPRLLMMAGADYVPDHPSFVSMVKELSKCNRYRLSMFGVEERPRLDASLEGLPFESETPFPMMSV